MDDIKAVLERHTHEDVLWMPDDLQTAQRVGEELYATLATALARIEVLERPRPEVRAFALLMEAELAKHDDRDGWQDCSIEWLLKRLQEEIEELAVAPGLQPRGEEAADVANFAMMIADVSGALAAKEGGDG